MTGFRVALVQLNTVVGDLNDNAERIIKAVNSAEASLCDLVVFSELAVTGASPRDLLLKPSFVSDNLDALSHIAATTRETVAMVGFVDSDGAAIYDAVAVCVGGRVVGVHRKAQRAGRSILDECRYFSGCDKPVELWRVGGVKVGVLIGGWPWEVDATSTPVDGSLGDLAGCGAELIVNLAAVPYRRGISQDRQEGMVEWATEYGVPVALVNAVGGQDDLVYDGCSLAVDSDGTVVGRAPQFDEAMVIVDLDCPSRLNAGVADQATVFEITQCADELRDPVSPVIADLLDPLGEVYQALVLATRDYVQKNGFADVVLGLSAGIDSSLVAVIAVDALGADHVHGVLMPSRHSSDGSVSDSVLLAQNLGIDHRTIPIEPAHAAFEEMLQGSFIESATTAPAAAASTTAADLTWENVQPRIRGMLLMALSNKFGWLVLTTGNKSETAVGYSTLYGDTAGGFAVIKDVYKTLVYELAHYRNEQAGYDLIPQEVLTKAPSAELRPDQRDDQSLPPYDVLDPLLERYIEDDTSAADLLAEGYDPALVNRVVAMVEVAEYKRRQSPPGPRITTKALGIDRRYPVTHRYR